MTTKTRLERVLRASPERVYAALVDADAVRTWMVPDGMTSHVHAFDAREGGAFRISLVYDGGAGKGKSEAHTDTYHGRFVELVPGAKVVQTMSFETDDPSMQGEMRTTFVLRQEGDDTHLEATHDDVPPGVRAEDNELGWSMALDKLARIVER